MAGVPVFLGATALLALGAGALTALLRLADPLDRLLAFGTLVLAQLTLTLLLAGAVLDHLEAGTVLGLNAAVAAAAVACGYRAGALPRRRPAWRFRAAPLAAAARRHPFSAALAFAAALVFLWRAFLVVLLPPYAYDGLSYHLTTVAEWMDRGRLVANPLSLCCAHYPANGELAFAWPAVLLGRDTLVDGVQLPFAVLGAVAVSGLARRIGLSYAGAVVAGSLFFLTPVVVEQTTANYVDVMVAASFLTAVYFLVRAFQQSSRYSSLGLSGCTAGFAAGTKPTGVVFAAILLALLLVRLAIAASRGGLPARPVAAGLIAFLVPLLALGAFWYGRNAVDFGNPVHPFRVEIAGLVVFEGTRKLNDILTVPEGFEGEPTWRRVARSWWSDVPFWRHGTYTYESRLGGLGPLWPYLGLPLSLVLAGAALRRREASLLILLAAVLLSVVLLPYKWWSRFTIPLAAVGALAVVFCAESIRARWGRSIVLGGAAILVGAGLWLSLERVDPAGQGRVLSLRRLAELAGKPSGARTTGALFFPEYRWVDGVPRRSVIGVDLQAERIRFVYPLFGPDLDHDVRRLVAGDAGGLERVVSEAALDYLFVGRGGRYDRWARARPDRYLPTPGGGAGAVVYRVLDRTH